MRSFPSTLPSVIFKGQNFGLGHTDGHRAKSSGTAVRKWQAFPGLETAYLT